MTLLAAAERRELIDGADKISYAVEVLVVDPAQGVVDDITDQVSAVEIAHGSFQAIHRTVRIDTTARLEWGYHRIAVSSLISSGGLSDRVPVGVFQLTAPARTSGARPSTATVDGADLLLRLSRPLVRAYTGGAGQPVLFLVRDLLASRGLPQDRIDNARGAAVLPSALVIPLDDDPSALSVINELLASVGYDGVHMDRDGRPRAEPYLTPDQQPLAWQYDTTDEHTIVAPDTELVDDYTDTPNYWRFTIADVERDTPPGPGDGEHIVNNYDDGPASQNARGEVVPYPRSDSALVVNSQADLVTQGDRIVAETKYSNAAVTMSTLLNPYHGHRDVVSVFDADLGLNRRMQHVSWTMQLLEGTMTHDLRAVAGVTP